MTLYIGLLTQNITRTQPFCLGKETTPLSEITVLVKTNSMEHIPSRTASTSSDSQEINHILCNPMVHYHVMGHPPLDTTLNQMNPTSPFIKGLTTISSFSK